MNHKSFVSCKLHSLLGFSLMLHFMGAPGMAGKAENEVSSYTKQFELKSESELSF